ncbi:MAG TPA: N-acetyltransferase [Spirochaetota bacterium]|nr:N-acetyltransferase [Spirochaetota bacterium]HOM38345.1 N-acetyltransferase [Spirochaetota bacterium]HPQ48437.1 N-acetyltransferase [Spirochaetota bacterium]
MGNIKKPTLKNGKDIHTILNYYASKGLLLARPLSHIYTRIREFFVYEENNNIVGCVALSIIWEDLGEIRSLAVKEEYQKKNIGADLVKAAIEEAKSLGLTRVFTLTYVPEFFKKLGFFQIEKTKLPHKIWSDCINCPHYPNCNEIALEYNIEPI